MTTCEPSPGVGPPPFVVRCVSVDYYFDAPRPGLDAHSPLHGALHRVPVLRIFGSTPAGQRAVLHVHRVFPTFYVRYDEALPQGVDEAKRVLQAVANGLEQALKAQTQADEQARGWGQAPAGQQRVVSTLLVRARPFYGFSQGDALFIRIALVDPRDVRVAAALLATGRVLNRVFVPHEAHVPYELQAMMDLHIAGMGLVLCARVCFRGRLPPAACAHRRLRPLPGEGGSVTFDRAVGDQAPVSGGIQEVVWTSATQLPAGWLDAGRTCMSTCELEADVAADDVLNRRDVCTTPLQAATSSDRLVQSLKPLWDDEMARAAAMGAPPPELKPHSQRPDVARPQSELQKSVREVLRACAAAERSQAVAAAQLEAPPPASNAAVPPGARGAGGGARVTPAVSHFSELLRHTQAANSLDALFTSALSPSSSGLTVAGPVAGRAVATAAARVQSLFASPQPSPPEDAPCGDVPGGHLNVAAVMPSQHVEEGPPVVDECMPFSQEAGPPAAAALQEQMQGGLSQEEQEEEEEQEELWRQGAMLATCPAPQPPPDVHIEDAAPPSPPPAAGLLSPGPRGGTAAAAPTPVLPAADATQLPGGTLVLTARVVVTRGQAEKVCYLCRKECLRGGRGFSSSGGYFHLACRPAVATAPVATGEPSPPSVMPQAKRAAPSQEPDGEQAEPKKARAADPPPPVCGLCGHQCVEGQHREEVNDGVFMHMACLPQPTQAPAQPQAQAPMPMAAPPGMGSQPAAPGTRFVLRWRALPPSKARVMATLAPQVLNHGAAYSRPQDKPAEQAAYLPWEVVVPPGAAGDTLRRFAPPAPPPAVRESPGLVTHLCVMPFSQGPRLYVASLAMWARWANTPQDGASWQQAPAGRRRGGQGGRQGGVAHRQQLAITPAKPPPRRAAVVAWLDARRVGRAPAPRGAAPAARPAAAPEPEHGADSSSDEEDALVLSSAGGVGAVNPGRGGGPAQVGLLVGADAWGADEPVPRPPSPKYETDVTFWDVMQATTVGPAALVGEPGATAAADETPATQPSGGGAAGAPAQPAGGEAAGEARSRRRRSSAVGAPSQITGPSVTHTSTPASQAGFRPGGPVGGVANHVSVMTIEMCAQTRGKLVPDPAHDAVLCVAVCLLDESAPAGQTLQQVVLLLDPPSGEDGQQLPVRVPGTAAVHSLPHEAALFEAFISLVKATDPDILLGYDVQTGSLGYLAQRHAVLQAGKDRRLGAPLLRALSRTPAHSPPGAQFQDTYGRDHMAGMWVTGRVVFNLWRILRAEVKLQSYTYQAAAAAVLRRRVPHVPPSQLHAWHSCRRDRWRAAHWVLGLADGGVRLCQQLDLVARTSELARVFGIQLEDVVVRGSQHRVESMMLRLAHSQNFVAISPTKDDLRRIPAPAHIALVMEPVSGFYTSPVVVLDFQSLYPSQIIAYNLCYSTSLGTLPGCTPGELLDTPRSFGVTSLTMPKGLLTGQDGGAGVDALYVAPNGSIFVPPGTRTGVLPRLLTEILDTRVMVKTALKAAPPGARVLQRCLQARQLGLKLIANVTYGYTAANFSGRMPLPELADAIVSSGRATLERAIDMVNSRPEWDARVVYGDTDSLFVHLPGRTKDQAFAIGAAIAAAVTAANPAPVKLQLEKVYQPCLLVTKKRYVGMAWDNPQASAPVFDAKGIETVRRDSCGAVSKTVERSLRLLFATRDLSRVKAYLLRQWARIYGGRLSVADATYAKEVRMGTYAEGRLVPASALVADRAMEADIRTKPPMGMRVPYVVVDGLSRSLITDMVHSPAEFLAARGSLHLNAQYYINQQVAALQRLLALAGGNVKAWAQDIPRLERRDASKRGAESNSKNAGGIPNITAYFQSNQCAVCGQFCEVGGVVCTACVAAPQETAAVLGGRVRALSLTVGALHDVCGHCGGGDGAGDTACISLDCPVMYERHKRGLELAAAEDILGKAQDPAEKQQAEAAASEEEAVPSW